MVDHTLDDPRALEFDGNLGRMRIVNADFALSVQRIRAVEAI